MNVRRAIAKFATEGVGKHVLPAGVRNRAYRMLIDDLIHEAKAGANSGEILLTPAMPCDRTSSLKVATLVSGKDLEMLLWCLKSLFYFSGASWDLWVFDGGLNDADERLLAKHFPGAHICREPDLTSKLLEHLSAYPLAREFRMNKRYLPAKKIIDVPWMLQNNKFLLIDSDVLFFRSPVELLDRLRQPKVDRFAFSVDKLGINSGVAIVPGSRVSFPNIEAILASLTSAERHTWLIEQNLYAELAKDRYDQLPDSYAIEPVQSRTYSNLACCHFVHVCRHRFYGEGIPQLRKVGFIEGLRSGNRRQSA